MPVVEYMNSNIYYIESDPNQLFCGKLDATKKSYQIETGWHFLPNQLWQNYLTPKQHFDLITNHDKIRPKYVKWIIQNMINLTDSLSIAQDTTFVSFNNTVYAVGYTDKHYETIFKEVSDDLMWREGVKYGLQNNACVMTSILKLPKYVHYVPVLDKPLTGFAWDPLCDPIDIMELRPGKNAITYEWNRHSSDDDKWYSTGKFFATQNTGNNDNLPEFQDYSTDIKLGWITPGQLMKQDPRSTNYNKTKTSHYKYLWNYPIPNMFIKIVPIVGTDKKLIRNFAQVVVIRKIGFDVTPRSNHTNYPQMQAHFAASASWQDPEKLSFPLALRPYENIGQPPPYDIDNSPFSTPALSADLKLTYTQLNQLMHDRRGHVQSAVSVAAATETTEKTGVPMTE